LQRRDGFRSLHGFRDGGIEVAWTPQPIVQMTLRTPLYAVRN